MGRSAGFFSSYGYHHNVGANTWRSRGGKPAGRERAGLERVAFAVSDRKELERLRNRIGRDAATVSRQSDEFVVRDPDGIELQFFER
jgi:catechol-2,3-dioxygenase